jgi:hypothetical protein
MAARKTRRYHKSEAAVKRLGTAKRRRAKRLLAELERKLRSTRKTLGRLAR